MMLSDSWGAYAQYSSKEVSDLALNTNSQLGIPLTRAESSSSSRAVS